MKTQFDSMSIYCRKLGHHLKFSYCRQQPEDRLCPKIIDCWFDRIPIQEYLANHYPPEAVNKLLTPSPPKMLTLFELIQQAQKQSRSEETNRKPGPEAEPQRKNQDTE